MTTILLQRSDDPYTCMCCGRMAIGIGVHEPRKPVHAWLCGDATCMRITRALITMKSVDLNACEKRACEAAAQAITEDVLTDVMANMWDAGVRDLSAATPEQIEAALQSLGSAMTDHVASALTTFGAHVKQEFKDGICPF